MLRFFIGRVKSQWGVWLVGFGLIIFTLISPWIIPFNMDEVGHYHAAACRRFPLSQRYHKYREACGSYDLTLPLTQTYLPLRGGYYIGAFQSLPFAPFWLLIDDPVASRIQGVGYFLLVTYLMARFLGVRFVAALLAGFIFPIFFFPFILETGIVGLELTLLMLTLLALRNAISSPRPKSQLVFASLAGFLTFLAITVKLVFVWLLPAIILFALWEVRERRPGRWVQLLQDLGIIGGSFLLSLVLPLGYYLFSRDVSGQFLYQVSGMGHFSLEPASLLAITKRLGIFLLDGGRFYHRVIQLPTLAADILPAVVFLLTLGLGWRAAMVNRQSSSRLLLWSVAALLVFGMTITSQAAWSPHHLIFALVFLVMAAALALNTLLRTTPRAFVVVVLTLVSYWLTLALRLPAATISPDTNFAKDKLVRLIREKGLDVTTIQVHASWGTYYLSHHFGDKRQAVLYIDDGANNYAGSPQYLKETKEIAQREGRGLTVVTTSPQLYLQSPLVESILGRSSAIYQIENWAAIVYPR